MVIIDIDTGELTMGVRECREGNNHVVPRFFMEMVSMKEANRKKNTKDAIIISIILLIGTFLGIIFGITPMFPNYIVAITFGVSLEMFRFYGDVAKSLVDSKYILKDKGKSSWQRKVILLTYNIISSINKIAYISIGLCTIQLFLSKSFLSYIVSFAELIAIIKVVTTKTMIDKEIKYGWDVFWIIILVSPFAIISRFFVGLSMGTIYFTPLIAISWFVTHLIVNKYFNIIMKTSRRTKDGKDDNDYVTILEGDFDGARLVDRTFRDEEIEREKKSVERRIIKEEEDRKKKEEERLKKLRGPMSPSDLCDLDRIDALNKLGKEPTIYGTSKKRDRRIGFGWYDEETYQNYLRDYELGPYSRDYKENNPEPKEKEETGGYVDVEDDSSSVNRFRNKR